MNLHPSRDHDEWRPEDEYPYQPPSNGRPPRRSRRKPSLLDAIKEEEIVSETLAMPPVKIEAAPAPAPKLELTPRKRRKAPEPAASKKRRLMKTAEEFAKNAREQRTTMKWHKCCRQTFLHARKFRDLLEGFEWWTIEKTLTPPVDALANDNMKMFFVKCWETGSKPNVQQGRKWLSHSLTKHGRPPLNKYHRQHYNETLDMLKGLAKEPEWREHVPKSTAAFDLNAAPKLAAPARKSSTQACSTRVANAV